MATYSNPAIDQIYELLFCDEVELYRRDFPATEYPWSTLFDSESGTIDLERIVNDAELETRPKVLAANRLRSLGRPLDNKRLFAVIVEVGMDQGLDVLAAYEDGTARYINYTESMIVWDSKTEESNDLVVDLFLASRNVVEQIGPWDRARLARPAAGNIRMTFLVADGLYFGEGPFEALAKDPIGGPVVAAATKLMQFLVMTARP